MHRTDLIDRTGPYNERLNVLIDWDMTRRLAFFSDFHHICDITGEFYSPVGHCDRISVQQRKDKNEYLRNALAIRTTRPLKPWSKIEDMSVILVAARLDRQAVKTIGSIWRYTFYPYRLFLTVPQADIQRLAAKVPNTVAVPVSPSASETQRIDAALAQCDGDYVAIVPSGFDVGELSIEDALCGLLGRPVGHEAIEMDHSTNALWAAVLRKSHLQHTRDSFPNLPVRQSLEAAGITLRKPRPADIPFQFDQLLEQAQRTENNGDPAKAGQIFEHIAARYQNQLWMKSLAAAAWFKAGDCSRAAHLSRQVNQTRPTVDTLLLEAKIKRKEKDFGGSIDLLQRAQQILQGKELSWT
jgi:hypothetical protein